MRRQLSSAARGSPHRHRHHPGDQGGSRELDVGKMVKRFLVNVCEKVFVVLLANDGGLVLLQPLGGVSWKHQPQQQQQLEVFALGLHSSRQPSPIVQQV